MLRPYQKKAIDLLYKWFTQHDGHPCLVLPTGSGKSHIIAELCKDALQNWPETRILMLTHVKELIEQDAAKLRQHWPNAPLGIYSAGIGKREIGEPITFAGIQSIRNQEVGHIDLVIIDEAHLVSHKAEGVYRTFLGKLQETNPDIRVIGLTATPYRMGHGLITDGSAIFDDLIEPVTIEELQDQVYLADLRSKVTLAKLSADGVSKRGGEYIEKDLQRAVDIQEKTEAVVTEVIQLAGDRKSWLFFCTGVEHAQHVKDVLIAKGVEAECITGKTDTRSRQRIIEDFKQGKIRALTNANVLTTGFDHPDTDLIVMMRPTLSPGLYTQMAGRGLRLKTHTDHCLVLDFAGVVEMHGPITAVRIPRMHESDSDALAPSKICPGCDEIIAAQNRICPRCGYEFPITTKKDWHLHDDDIMGRQQSSMQVCTWSWDTHTSRKSGKEMVKVTYYGALTDRPVTEYLCLFHDGYAGQKALGTLKYISAQCGVTIQGTRTIEELCERLSASTPPSVISYRKDGQFHRVLERIWDYPGTEHDYSNLTTSMRRSI